MLNTRSEDVLIAAMNNVYLPNLSVVQKYLRVDDAFVLVPVEYLSEEMVIAAEFVVDEFFTTLSVSVFPYASVTFTPDVATPTETSDRLSVPKYKILLEDVLKFIIASGGTESK